MKAVVTRGHGGLDMLDYTDVPVPTPKAWEVLVKVTAAGLNNTDIWSRMGAYGTDRDPNAVVGGGRGRKPGNFPIINGIDVVGRVAAVGEGVDRGRVGERVILNFVTYEPNPNSVGFAGSLATSLSGGYAEYIAVQSVQAYEIGDSPLSDEELATLPCTCLTGEHMLSEAGVKAGETVLITGASGGMGSMLIQLVHARGAHAVAVTSKAWAAEVATLEPLAVVNRDEGNLVEAVTAAMGAPHLEVVADVVGGPQFPDYLALLGPAGRYVTAGAIGGPVVALDLRTIYLKKLRLYGVSTGYQHHFETALQHIRAGRIRPLLARTYALSEIKQAQADFVAKDFFGNLVVLPGS
jgi:NADPH:quinone reductase-like Zn-dependent oxidoreductase